MSTPLPPEVPNDSDDTPTLPEGVPFHPLDNLDDLEVAEMRAAYERLAAETNRAADGAPTRLEELGPFRDLVEIGRGGMGRVYRTLDPQSGEDVAVKVTAPALKNDLNARRRFLREAKAAESLKHPGIVKCRGWGEDDGGCYIVCDLCDGPNLEAWLKARKGSVPPREAARIVRVLAEAVEHAHSQGVLHRDLKPSNVLLPGATVNSDAEDLSPRLTDFGLARAVDLDAPAGETPTATGLILGSPPYMAPEQAAGGGHEVDRRTDVYGLGAVLYAVLTARAPFRGENPRETMRMVINDDPIPIRVLRPGVPKTLETITLTCLEKLRDNRYQTAGELSKDLEAFLENRPIKAPGISRAESLRRWSRRRPKAMTALVAAVASLAVLLVAIAAWTYELTNHVEELRRERDVIARLGYDATIQSAGRDVEDGRLGVAQSKLADLIPKVGQPDHREYAWRHLTNAARREVHLLPEDAIGFDLPTISPDGRLIAMGVDASPLQVYDLESERSLWAADLQNQGLAATPSFSPDGRLLAVCFQKLEETQEVREVRLEVRDAASGWILRSRTFVARSPTLEIHLIDADRVTVATQAGDPSDPGKVEVRVLSTRNSLLESQPAEKMPGYRGCSPDGRRFAAISPGGRLGVYDVDKGWLASSSDAPAAADVRSVVFDAKGRRMAVSLQSANVVQLHDVESGRLSASSKVFAAPVDGIVVNPSRDAFLIHEVTEEVRLVEQSRGIDFEVYPATKAPGVSTQRMLFSPDGSVFFVHRSEFQAADHIEVRQSDDASRLGESPGRVKAQTGRWLVRTGSREQLIYGLGRRIWQWDWRTTIAPRPVDTLQAHHDEAWVIAYSPDMIHYATGSDNDGDKSTLKLWDVATNQPLRSWDDPDSMIADLAFAPDGEWIASAHLADEHAVRIRSTSGGEPINFELSDAQRARSVAFHPSGEILFAGGEKGELVAWDLQTHKRRWSMRVGSPRAVALNQLRIHDLAVCLTRAQLASAADDGSVRIHDVDTGAVLFHYLAPSSAYSLAYSPDGRTLAAADREGVIHLLDAATGELIRPLHGDDSELRSIAFSPDGRTLAAGGLGRIVRLWDPETAHELLSLKGAAAQINSIAFSKDGCTLAASDHTGTVFFWRGPHP